jgi:hypothetical protein
VFGNLLTKTNPIKKLQADLKSKRDQSSDLAAHLSMAQTVVEQRKAKTARLAVSGAIDSELDAAEAASRSALDRVSTLLTASLEVDAQIMALEAESAQLADTEHREAVAIEVEALAREVEAFAPIFHGAITKLAEITGRCGIVVPEAGAIAMFATSVKSEITTALVTIPRMLRANATWVRSRHVEPKRPVVALVAPPVAVVPGETQPPADVAVPVPGPTRRRGVLYRGPSGLAL